MGGLGSGAHFLSQTYRYTIENCVRFSYSEFWLLKNLNDPSIEKYWSEIEYYRSTKLIFVGKGRIKRDGENSYLQLQTKSSWTDLKVMRKVLPTGGGYPVLLCPLCSQPRFKFYLKPPHYDFWSCRECHDLTYQVCNESTKPLSIHYLLAARLGCSIKTVRASLERGRLMRKFGTYIQEQIYTEDTHMQSTTLKLSDRQVKLLNQLSQTMDLSKAELIRRAIDEFFERSEKLIVKK